MRLLVAALFVAAFAQFTATRAYACDCPAQSPTDAFSASVAVLEGRVLRVSPAVVEEGAATVAVELSVVRTWKGAEHERITLHTAAHADACGFSFARDESYLVYATEHADHLWVDRCGRTRLIAEASADLKALGLGVTPVEPKNEAKKQRPAEPPAQGGCAGCTVGATTTREHGRKVAWPLGALAGFGLARRVRSRRARTARG